MDISNVYAANGSSDTLSVFLRNTSSGALSGTNTIGTGAHPDIVVVSPDGKNVYTTNKYGHTISVFDRNLTSGDLSYNSTINASEYPSSGPLGISISPDGKNVYVGCFNINRISIFDRNLTTGALTFNNSIASVGTGPWGIVVSLDGLNVYVVANTQNELRMFSRDILTGLLSYIFAFTPTGGLAVGSYPTSICISLDDLFVYVSNSNSNSISAFFRSGGILFDSVGGPYSTGNMPYGICISADGKNVYTSNISSQTVSVFDRSTSFGTLTLTDSVSALNGIIQIAISADGKNVYVSNAGASNNVSIFDRDLITGALSGTTTIATGTAPFGIAVFTNSFSPVQTALLIDVQPYGVVSGDPFTTQPIIKIVDSNGDLVPTATDDVEVAITVVNGSGSLTGTTTVTAVGGYATFTDLVFTGAGSFYLTFTSTGLTQVDSDEIATLTPTELVVYVQPSASISGQLLSTQPTVKIINWLGDLVPDATDVVDVSLVDVTGSSVLTGTLNATASGGYAAFTDLIATGYGSFYLTFTSGTLTSVNSDTLFFTPDPGNPNPPIPVKPKRSYIPLSVPTSGDMETNEFAINVADKKGYVRDSNGIIHQVFDGNASGGGVTSIIAGTGINIDNSTGNVTISTVASAPSLEQLTDVQITSKTDGQLLRYFAPTQKWVNSNIVDGGNF